MKLASAATLRALMEQKGISYADMALATGRSKGFISHLAKERRSTCKPEVAERIARRLDVPLTLLFVPSTSTSTVNGSNGSRKVAA